MKEAVEPRMEIRRRGSLISRESGARNHYRFQMLQKHLNERSAQTGVDAQGESLAAAPNRR